MRSQGSQTWLLKGAAEPATCLLKMVQGFVRVAESFQKWGDKAEAISLNSNQGNMNPTKVPA